MSPYFNRLAWVASLALSISIFSAMLGGGGIILGIIFGMLLKIIIFPTHVMKEEKIVSQNFSQSPTSLAKKAHTFSEVTTEEIDDVSQDSIIENQEVIEPMKPREPKKPNPVALWFAENTLAKVGGILIFLAIVAFLTVIYTSLGPVGRLVISFLVSAGIYIAGLVIVRKDTFRHEGQVVLGVGVVALYLSSLYIMRVPEFQTSFGNALQYIVLFLLVAAVALGSMTGIIFGAPVLFFFSLIVAYLNPYFLGLDLSVFQWVAYILVITGGTFLTVSLLASQKKHNYTAIVSSVIATIWGLLSLLVLHASTHAEINTLLLSILAIVCGGWFVGVRLTSSNVAQMALFGGSIAYALFLMTQIGLMPAVSTTLVLWLVIVGLLWIVIKNTTSFDTPFLVWLLFFPLVLWLVGYWFGFWVAPAITFVVMCFLSIGVMMFLGIVSTLVHSILLIALGVTGMYFGWLDLDLPESSQYLLLFSSLVMYAVGQWYFLTKNIAVSPTIHMFVMIVLMIVVRPDLNPVVGILVASLVALGSVIVSYRAASRDLLSTEDQVIIPLLGAIFVIGTSVYFWAVKADWWLMLGVLLLIIAVMYFILFFVLFWPGKRKIPEYMAVTFPAIIVGIITLSFVYIFTGHESARTLAWLVEAGVLWYVFSRYHNHWIQAGAIAVQVFGLIQLVILTPNWSENALLLIVTGLLILADLWFLGRKDITVVWSEIILLISTLIWYSFVLADVAWSDTTTILVTEGVLLLLLIWQIYAQRRVYQSGILLAVVVFWIAYVTPDWYDNYEVFSGWLYLILPFLFAPVAYFAYRSEKHVMNIVQACVIGIGIFIVTSIWISHHFTNPYMITIWWSLWIAWLLVFGIQKKVPTFRSFGLLIYLLTLLRIVFVDLGRIFSQSGGNGVYVGIGIILLLGIVSIALSMLYKKLMGESALKKDFLFQRK